MVATDLIKEKSGFEGDLVSDDPIVGIVLHASLIAIGQCVLSSRNRQEEELKEFVDQFLMEIFAGEGFRGLREYVEANFWDLYLRAFSNQRGDGDCRLNGREERTPCL
jgi:hypothetical protein